MQGKKYQAITDRAEAIEAAVKVGRSGDLVLIAGKGHETYQQFATETIDFDDRAVARRVLREHRVDDLKQRMDQVKEKEQEFKKRRREDE